MSVFIVRANPSLKTLSIYLSATTCFGRFGQRQVRFTTTYVEKYTEEGASPLHLMHKNTYVVTILPYKGLIKYVQQWLKLVKN